MKNRITRRKFLEQAARAAGGAALGSLPIIQARCKGTTESEPPPAQDVTVSIKFYNHTQGELGEKSYSGKSGQPFGVSIDSLGYSGVDTRRIAVRKAAARDTMGALVGFSRTGTIALQYPVGDESWEAYLMNAGAQQQYQYIDEDVDLGWGWGALKHPRNLVWHRGDEDRTGPDEPIFEAIRQLGSALDYPWKVYGSYPQGAGGVAVGYAHLTGTDQGPAYWLLNDSFIWVDPERAPTDIDKLKWFIDAIFGYSTAVFSLDGGGSAGRNQTICDQATGNLNAIGQDLLAYVYVKDVMTSPSSMHQP
ncbi:MAG: hypothetical protein NT147_02130 [Candidatus Aminicenantes bacterium]|nr:hypothetical protein [Candidatus Aminicenantes bacterium]